MARAATVGALTANTRGAETRCRRRCMRGRTHAMRVISQGTEKLSDLRQAQRNPRKGDVDAIGASVKALGFFTAVTVRDEDGSILVGNHRVRAAEAQGLEEVPVLRVSCTDDEARRILLADNRLSDVAEYDDELLRDLLRVEVQSGGDLGDIGFDVKELSRLERETAVDEDEDVVPPPPTVADSVAGRVYELGPHRLICGDSTKAETWDALGLGAAACTITSPPYGLGSNTKLRGALASSVLPFYDDHVDDPGQWRALMDGASTQSMRCSVSTVVNLQMLAGNKVSFIEWLHAMRDHVVDVMVWDKGRAQPALSPGVVNANHELVIVLAKKRNPSRRIPFASFHGDVSSVINVSPGHNEFADVHRAVFPVAFAQRLIRICAATAGEVIDCFAGTGTTLIAAAAESKSARLIEISPQYCDVIRRRWTSWARAHGVDAGPGALE